MTNTISNTGYTAVVNTTANILTALQANPSADLSGFQLQVTNFKLGSLNTPFDPTLGDVPGTIVYNSVPGQLKAITTSDPDTIIYVVQLDSSVGGFAYGSVGLYLATGQMITYDALPEVRTKIADNQPGVIGNTHVYYIPISVSRTDTIFTVNLPSIDPQTLPIVANDGALPSPTLTPFDAYIVRAYSGASGSPAFAYTDGTTWSFLYPGMSGGGGGGGTTVTILQGSGPPASGLGAIGDSYIDDAALVFYPAKTSGGWPIGINMRGSPGSPGAPGHSVNLIFGAGAPSGATGVVGDNYFDSVNHVLYPAKTSLGWGTGVNLTGLQGPAGLGIPTGGSAKQVLAKLSSSNYDVQWQDQPAQAYDLGGFVVGTPLAGEEIFQFTVTRLFELAAGFSPAMALAKNVATADTVFTVYQNSTVIGTMTFLAGVANAQFATVASTTYTFNPGDVFSIYAPSTPDATLANFSFTFNTFGTVIYSSTGIQGPQGIQGEAGVGIPGVGIPPGGVIGQVLIKAALPDYNTAWTGISTLLPTASTTVLGVVKAGAGITIASDGTIAATGSFSGTLAFTDLTDVSIAEGPGIDGYFPQYSNSLGKWIASAGVGITTLQGLTDVNVTEGAPINGFVLTWQNASSKWIAQLPAPAVTSVNGHTGPGAVIVSANDITTGTLPNSVLPAPSGANIGAVKAGTNITIGVDGTISASGGGGGGSSTLVTLTDVNITTGGGIDQYYVGWDNASGKFIAIAPHTSWGLTSINGHSATGAVVISATDITTGTLPSAQLPAPTGSNIGAVKAGANITIAVDGTISSSGGGASAFTSLTDVPGSYTGNALKSVRVNAGATALEFYTPSGGATTLNTLTDVNVIEGGGIDTFYLSWNQSTTKWIASSPPTSWGLTTINGHSATGAVVVSASDITTGTLPNAVLPAPAGTALGAVKAGLNITIAVDGTIAASGGGGNAASSNRNITLRAPLASQFSNIVQISPHTAAPTVIDDAANGLVFYDTVGQTGRVHLLRNIPGTPATFEFAARLLWGPENGNTLTGLTFMDASGNYVMWDIGSVGTVPFGYYLGNTTTDVAYNLSAFSNSGGTWLKIGFDATNVYVYTSSDGYNWSLYYTYTLAAIGIGAPTQYGFNMGSASATTSKTVIPFFYSDEFTAPALANIAGLTGISSSTLVSLSDVNITTGSGVNGYGVVWNNSSGKFILAAAVVGPLSGLTDVNVTEGGGIDTYYLSWNNSTSKWIASAPPTSWGLTTINGHSATGSVVISGSDITTGTIPTGVLPIATGSTLGVVKAGTNISIAGDGTISAAGGGGGGADVPIGIPSTLPTGGNVRLLSLVNLCPEMTSDTAPSGYVASASSEYSSGVGQAWNAFKDVLHTGAWLTAGTNTGWLGMTFPTGVVVSAYEIVGWSLDSWNTRVPVSWTFEGSNDGFTTNTTLDTQSIDPYFWQQWVPLPFFIPANTTSYTSYRINVTANNGNAYLGINQLKMMGVGTPSAGNPALLYSVDQYGNYTKITMMNGSGLFR